MAKGIENKRYTAEFKVMVIETMRREELSYHETQRRFELPNSRVQALVLENERHQQKKRR